MSFIDFNTTFETKTSEESLVFANAILHDTQDGLKVTENAEFKEVVVVKVEEVSPKLYEFNLSLI